MLSVKGGTQTWSTSKQQVDYKSDGVQNVSATDKQKYMSGGDETVGDQLNKVADPNYVDTSKKMRTVGESQLGKDAFMTLLLTQMKNQDPTNPLKSHEMAAQLAQFTSLEKLNNINEGIDKLRKDNQPDHNFQALAFIGKTVTMDNSKITRTGPTEVHDLRFSLPQDSQKANIEIRDAAGNTVRKMEMKNLKQGPNSFVWDGKTDEGAGVGLGDYSLSVEAFGSNGKKLYVQTKADGVITGVNFTSHGPQLLMGKNVINLADVKSISDSHVGNQDPQALMAEAMRQGMPNNQAVPPQTGAGAGAAPQAGPGGMVMTPQGKPVAIPPELLNQAAHSAGAAAGLTQSAPVESPKKVEVKPELKGNEAKRAKLASGTINDSGMASGLINKLNKEGAKAGM